MTKSLTAILTLAAVFVLTSQASAQVATFSSLSLQFSNSLLSTVQPQQAFAGEAPAFTKQHLTALPATGYTFGENSSDKPVDILAAPAQDAKPMSDALATWVNNELALQQNRRRSKQ